LRLGTPALTTRGMKEAEMQMIAGFIKKVLDNPPSDERLKKVRDVVSELCRAFPIYEYAGEEV
jgi:glycine hydroxymethyltransferase